MGTCQLGQRKVASEVVKGVIVSTVRLGVVRRVRTGVVLDCLGVEVGAGAEVGWLIVAGWEDSGEGRSGGCEESFVALREGEPGWESAREA